MAKELKVIIQFALTTDGNKTIAWCDVLDNGKVVDDFCVVKNSLKETLLKLKDDVIELEIPFNRVEILGEFDSDDLSQADQEIWKTPIKDLEWS